MRFKYAVPFLTIIALLIATLIFLVPGRSAQQDESTDLYIPVLMYHKIDDEGTPNTAVITSGQFREHLLALKEAGYETIFEAQLLGAVNHGAPLPEKPILITFDDGYLNNYTLGFPILKQLDMKASIYTIVSYRGQKPGWNEHFGWEHANEMIESGHISIQSHSYKSHHLIPTTRKGYLVGRLMDEEGNLLETSEQYEERVKNDITLSKQLIEEHTGQPVVSFSYPFGQYSAETEQWLEEAGYEMSLTVKRGVYRFGDPTWAIPRITVNGEWSGEELVEQIESYMQ